MCFESSSTLARDTVSRTSLGDAMLSILRPHWLLMLVLLIGGCATGPTVTSDFDQQANFAQYRTFAFAQPLGTDKAGYTTLLTERLKASTLLQMEQRGYVLDEKNPDLLVNFQVQVSNRTEYIPPPPMPWGPNYYGYRMGWYSPWAGYQFGPDVIQYTEGVLNVDLIDARKKQLVWEGIATSVIENLQEAQSEARIAAIVADIFRRYPFLAGSGVAQSGHR